MVLTTTNKDLNHTIRSQQAAGNYNSDVQPTHTQHESQHNFCDGYYDQLPMGPSEAILNY